MATKPKSNGAAKRVILVASEKGGVGKSVFARSLVDHLRNSGATVAAYDADGSVGALVRVLGTRDGGSIVQPQDATAGVGIYNIRSDEQRATLLDCISEGAPLIVHDLAGGSLADLDILSMMQEPWFVPDTTTLEEQLRAFRAHRSHFALVVDEYGALQGIVTREDILDEILGDIPDENEAESRGNIRKQKDGSYVVDGATPIRDLNRELDWNLPDDEATTIAGLVIYEARTIPEAKQRFSFYGYMFEILRRHRNQITAIRVTPPAANVERILPSP